MYLSRALERLGGNALSRDSEPDIGAAFFKFAVVTKELSALMKTLVSIGYITFHLQLLTCYAGSAALSVSWPPTRDYCFETDLQLEIYFHFMFNGFKRRYVVRYPHLLKMFDTDSTSI